jgi:probable addiction module antidote protein
MIKTTTFKITDYLDNPLSIAAYIEAALEDGDPKTISMALGDIARTNGMTDVARDAGITREALYKSLSVKGDPKLSTLLGVFKALGLKMNVKAVS